MASVELIEDELASIASNVSGGNVPMADKSGASDAADNAVPAVPSDPDTDGDTCMDLYFDLEAAAETPFEQVEDSLKVILPRLETLDVAPTTPEWSWSDLPASLQALRGRVDGLAQDLKAQRRMLIKKRKAAVEGDGDDKSATAAQEETNGKLRDLNDKEEWLDWKGTTLWNLSTELFLKWRADETLAGFKPKLLDLACKAHVAAYTLIEAGAAGRSHIREVFPRILYVTSRLITVMQECGATKEAEELIKKAATYEEKLPAQVTARLGSKHKKAVVQSIRAYYTARARYYDRISNGNMAVTMMRKVVDIAVQEQDWLDPAVMGSMKRLYCRAKKAYIKIEPSDTAWTRLTADMLLAAEKAGAEGVETWYTRRTSYMLYMLAQTLQDKPEDFEELEALCNAGLKRTLTEEYRTDFLRLHHHALKHKPIDSDELLRSNFIGRDADKVKGDFKTVLAKVNRKNMLTPYGKIQVLLQVICKRPARAEPGYPIKDTTSIILHLVPMLASWADKRPAEAIKAFRGFSRVVERAWLKHQDIDDFLAQSTTLFGAGDKLIKKGLTREAIAWHKGIRRIMVKRGDKPLTKLCCRKTAALQNKLRGGLSMKDKMLSTMKD